jgi:glycosyltransferase involved in cell wall biosynthesis
MADIAWDSGNLKHRPTVISNMVDSAVLRPFDDRAALRRRLGIGNDRLVLAASAGNINDARKGIRDTLETAARLRDLTPLVILLGSPDRQLHEHAAGVDFVSTGYVHERAELREWLSAADAFLFTSKADNQPLSILESLACGTPVYGFDTGGAVEMIADGVTGQLVRDRDVLSLSDIIRTDHLDGKMKDIRTSCREVAVTTYGSETFVSRHIELYEAALGKQDART